MTEKITGFKDYLDNFGLIKFAENNSLSIGDYERSFKRYLKIVQKKPRGRYKFADNSSKVGDFKRAFKSFFE